MMDTYDVMEIIYKRLDRLERSLDDLLEEIRLEQQEKRIEEEIKHD